MKKKRLHAGLVISLAVVPIQKGHATL